MVGIGELLDMMGYFVSAFPGVILLGILIFAINAAGRAARGNDFVDADYEQKAKKGTIIILTEQTRRKPTP